MKYVTGTFVILLLIAGGCDTPDERLVQQLANTSREVVEQNQEVARTQREIAEGSKRLVNAAAEARDDHREMQRELQQQRDALEQERKAIAGQRHWESLLAPVLENVGVLIIVALPLLLSWYLLHGLRTSEEDVSEELAHQLTLFAGELPDSRDHRQRIVHGQLPAEDEEPPPF